MSILSVILLQLFSMVSAVQITACGFESAGDLLRAVTKPMCIPLLCILTVSILVRNRVPLKKIVLTVLAYLFHAAGDFFLLWPEKDIFFMLGLGSFLAGHVLLIVLLDVLRTPMSKKAWLIYVPAVLAVLTAVIFAMGVFSDKGTVIAMASIIYGSILVTIPFSGFWGLKNRNRWGFPVFAGGIIFVISDITLILGMSNTIIMATYLMAESLIALGLIQSLKAENRA